MFNILNNKNLYSEKKKDIRQISIAAGLALLIFCVIFVSRDLFPIGDGSILMIDLHSQYVPLLYRFYDVVTGQKNLFMDLNASGGAYLYADTINELLNPFNYILLLFGRERIYLAVNLLLALYGIAATVSSCFCLQKLWPEKREWNVPLSLCYAFSGFVAAQFQIIKWMYLVVLFPVFLLAFFRVVREKKWGVYALLLAYQLMLSLQLGAMTLFFTLFASGFCFFYQKKKDADIIKIDNKEDVNNNEDELKKAVAALVLGTVAGVLISAVVWVPNVLQLLNSARGGENQSYLSIMSQHGLYDLFERLYQAFHPAVFAVGLYFLWIEWRRNRGRKGFLSREVKYLLIWNAFLWITVIAQPSNLIWHLGSYQCFPVRYAYMILLSEVLFVKCLAVDGEEKENTKAGMIPGIFAIVLCVSALFLSLHWAELISQGFSSLAISTVPSVVVKVVCILALMMVAGFLALWSGRYTRQIMTAIVCVMSGIYFLFVLLPQDYPVRQMNQTAYEEMTQEYDLQSIEAANESAQNLLHREDRIGWPLNAALVSGGRTMTGYFPSGSGKEYASAMEELGYLTPWVSTRSWGGTAVSDAVLGIERENFKQDIFTGGILLGQTTSEIQEKYENVSGMDPLAAQNVLGEVLTGQSPLEILEMDELPADADGSCVLELKKNSAVYLDAGVVSAEILVWVDDIVLELPEKDAAESPHYLLYLGSFDSGKINIKITDRSGNALSMEGRKLGVLDIQNWVMLESKIAALEKEHVAVDDRTGKIVVKLTRAEGAKALLLPVAYADGWQVSFNGKRMDTVALFGGFLGTEIREELLDENGTEIIFSFTPPGWMLGICLSLLGVFFILLSVVLEKVNKSQIQIKTFVNVGRRIALVLYLFVFCIGVLAVYIVPNVGLAVNMVIRVLGLETANNKTVQPPIRVARIEQMEEGIRVDLVEENLMLNKGVRVKADSEESRDFAAQLVMDGISDEGQNRWSSANDWEDNEHWLQVDLREETPVTCIKLFWERTNACEYAVEYSTDKKDWKTVAEFLEEPKEKEQTIFLETPVQARYLRLHVWDVTKNEEDLSLYYQNVSLAELEVYAEAAGSVFISKPEMESGNGRILKYPEMPEGYSIRVGGTDYANLIDENRMIADTLSDVEVELGFVLGHDGLEWELPGMKVVIPASEEPSIIEKENAVVPDSVEWLATDGYGRLLDEVCVLFEEDSKEDEELLQQMADLFKTELGVFLQKESNIQNANDQTGISCIHFVLQNEEDNSLGEEGCEIQIKEQEIRIIANSAQGIRWGCVELLEFLEKAFSENETGYLPCGIIRDYPRYEVRGFGIDVGRRAISMNLLYEIVKELSAHKMNTLQVHLNDNQIITQSGYDGTIEGAMNLYAGFRIESDMKNENGVGITSSDLYYTKEEFMQLIKDAKVYGVEIVPEIDTPAHCLSLTKVFTDVGMKGHPEAVDMLDLSKAEARALGKEIWNEFLPVFAECDALHLGMDEYFGDTKDYLAYLQELSEYINGLAPEKELRVWGSLTLKGGDLSGISRDLQMHIWDTQWADPEDMYKEGFSLINSLSSNLYLIPGGGYDWLDVEYLEENWQPNVYQTTERTWVLPAWSKQCLGACYMMWNDWAYISEEAITEDRLFDRFQAPLQAISDKLW